MMADLTGFTGPDAGLPRAFFGVGPADLEAAEALDADIDFTTRYRLLNKVLNSATHRGNVFSAGFRSTTSTPARSAGRWRAPPGRRSRGSARSVAIRPGTAPRS